MQGQILPRARERVENIREKIRERKFMGQASPAGTEQGEIELGGGKLLSRGREIAEKGMRKAEELRPGILPRVTERLERVKPFKRAKEEVLGEGGTPTGGTPAGTGETETSTGSPAGVGE